MNDDAGKTAQEGQAVPAPSNSSSNGDDFNTKLRAFFGRQEVGLIIILFAIEHLPDLANGYFPDRSQYLQ